jgi:hypothetical protein
MSAARKPAVMQKAASVEFAEVYDAVRMRHARPLAYACVDALQRVDIACDEMRHLRRVKRCLEAEHERMTTGALVVAILRAGTATAIAAIVSTLSPTTWPSRQSKEDVKRRAMELHADCFLALDTWLTDWKSRQQSN